jgi:hypothetical protein
MKVYLHAHIATHPNTCFWVDEDEKLSVHAEHAFEFEEEQAHGAALRCAVHYKVPIEFIWMPVEQPDALPDNIRKLVKLD